MCLLYDATVLITYRHPFVFAFYRPPVKFQINARACLPKPNIVPASRLSLSLPARVHGKVNEVNEVNEGRAASKPILEESAGRNKLKLKLLKCRDCDTEAGPELVLFFLLQVGWIQHYFIFIYL